MRCMCVIGVIAFTLCLGVVVLCGCAARQEPTGDWTIEPPFDWDSGYSSPETALRIVEVAGGPFGDTIVFQYEYWTRGFRSDNEAVFWQKQGFGYIGRPAVIRDDGRVLVDGADTNLVGGYVPGQALDVALVSRGKRAHARIFPRPIRAEGHCSWAEVELLSSRGDEFVVTFGGFRPGEEVVLESFHGGEHRRITRQTDFDGTVRLGISFETQPSGIAEARAIAGKCSVSVRYDVGKDAVKAD